MVAVVRFVQNLSAPCPSSVTLSGISMLVKLEQPKNAEWPIKVTVLGIVMLVNPVTLENAEFQIAVTELGINEFMQPVKNLLVAVSIIALQPSRESYFGLPSSTVILVSQLQPINAPSPIFVTVFGITRLVKPVHL